VSKRTSIIEASEPTAPSNSSLRKAVEAIAIKPHAGKLTLLARKINNVLLAEAQEQGINESIGFPCPGYAHAPTTIHPTCSWSKSS
jgi:hypothetical protein